MGSLEKQSMWGEWRELVMKTHISWHTLFKYGHSLIYWGFMLIAKSCVWNQLLTPAMVSK